MEGIQVTSKSRVWIRLEQAYKAIDYFTDDFLRRASLRVALRACPWRAGWNYAFADVLRRDDREFAAFILAMGA